VDRPLPADCGQAGASATGSCFPKDVTALIRTAREAKAPLSLIEQVEKINTERKNRAPKRICARPPAAAVGHRRKPMNSGRGNWVSLWFLGPEIASVGQCRFRDRRVKRQRRRRWLNWPKTVLGQARRGQARGMGRSFPCREGAQRSVRFVSHGSPLPRGTRLRVIGRESVIKVADPTTSKEGWIYEKYLTSREGPGKKQNGTPQSKTPNGWAPTQPGLTQDPTGRANMVGGGTAPACRLSDSRSAYTPDGAQKSRAPVSLA
jgi:hypothetical protein